MSFPIKHGLHGTLTYKTWKSMKARCYQSSHQDYVDYGGRGIKVCDAWLNDFSVFFADMGKRPSEKHTIERNNTNADYSPDNCRWATQKEQMQNTRRSKTVTIDGITKTVAQWSEESGVPAFRIYKRLKSGRDARDAVHGEKYSRI